MQARVDYCALDRTRLDQLETQERFQEYKPLKKLITAAYEGVASIESEELARGV